MNFQHTNNSQFFDVLCPDRQKLAVFTPNMIQGILVQLGLDFALVQDLGLAPGCWTGPGVCVWSYTTVKQRVSWKSLEYTFQVYLSGLLSLV